MTVIERSRPNYPDQYLVLSSIDLVAQPVSYTRSPPTFQTSV